MIPFRKIFIVDNLNYPRLHTEQDPDKIPKPVYSPIGPKCLDFRQRITKIIEPIWSHVLSLRYERIGPEFRRSNWVDQRHVIAEWVSFIRLHVDGFINMVCELMINASGFI